MISIPALRAMVAAGASAEMLLSVIEAERIADEEKQAADDAKRADRRAKDALRQRAKRVRDGHAMSRPVTQSHAESDGQPVTVCDTPPSPSPSSPLIPPNNPLPLPPLGGGDDNARGRGLSLISDEAGEIAAEIAEFCGIGPDPTAWPVGWYGSAMAVQNWLNEGCKREIILPACKEAAGKKRDGPPDKIIYFTKAVARAHAQFSAPMPTVIPAKPEQISGNRSNNGSSGWLKSTSAEILAELDGEGGNIEGDPPMRDITPASSGRG